MTKPKRSHPWVKYGDEGILRRGKLSRSRPKTLSKKGIDFLSKIDKDDGNPSKR